MFDRFTENSRQLIGRARLVAIRHRSAAIEPEHVLLGALELLGCNAVAVLQSLAVDVESLRAALDANLLHVADAAAQLAPADTLPFAPAMKAVLEHALHAAARLGSAHVGSEHLLLGLVHDETHGAAQVLRRLGATPEAVTAAISAALPLAARAKSRLLLISNSTMHGGGYLQHCAGEIRDFLGRTKRVMFVPYALHDHDAYAAKARAAFTALGHELFSVHERGHAPAALDGADCVFVGGGNTFRLLSALYHYGLLPAIRQRALDGMPYVGSSAGTNVATLSIRTTNDMPIVEPPSFTALQLVPFQINPHYLDPDPNSTHMGETREERLVQFHEEHAVPVLGLREGCMLRVEGRRMELRGTTRARLFRRGEPPQEFAPPCDLSFLLDA